MVLRKVGVLSVAKVAGVLYTALGLLFGLIFAAVSRGAGVAAQEDPSLGWLAPVFGGGAIVFFPILYGCMGAIGGAIAAALYNLVSGFVGGVELDIQT